MPPRYVWTDERDKVMLQAWLRTMNSLPRDCGSIAQQLGPNVSAAMVKSRLEFLARTSDDEADETNTRDQTRSQQSARLKRKRRVIDSSSDGGNESATDSERANPGGNVVELSPSVQGSSPNTSRTVSGQRHGVQVVIRQGFKSKPNPNLRKKSPDVSSAGSEVSSSGNEETDEEPERRQPHVGPNGINASRQAAGHPAARSPIVPTPQTARVSTTPIQANAGIHSSGTTKPTPPTIPSSSPVTARVQPPPSIPRPSIPIIHPPSTSKPASRPLDLNKRCQVCTYIPVPIIPYVIGKNGSHIKAVEKRTQAKILIVNSGPPTSANERITTIKGTVEQCRKAENAIKALAMSYDLGAALKAKMVFHSTLVFDATDEELEEDLRAFAARHRLL